MSEPRLLFIVGPTGTGKSDLAVEIVERIAGENRGSTSSEPAPEILNSDSVQFFSGVDVGAAKPGPELLKRARHHLVGHVDVGASYTAGDFRRDALGCIEERHRSGVDRFIAVGGSGFYVMALEKGMYEVPEVAPGTREALENEANLPAGLEKLHDEFSARDPEAAAKVSVRDRYRIVRALEVLRSNVGAGTLTEIKSRFEKMAPRALFKAQKIGLRIGREELRSRIEARTRAMIELGFIEEVRNLRERGFGDWAPLKSVGYREVQDFLDGSISEKELEAAIVTSTMQLAKKQMTWFKRDASIQWFDALKEWERAIEAGTQALAT